VSEIRNWSGREAADRLAKRGKNLANAARSKDELYRVLTLTVGIVYLWEKSLPPKEMKIRKAELIGLLEHRSGAKGGIEHYLLRAAFGHDPGRRKIVTAWAQACVNVAAYMRKARVQFNNKNVLKIFEDCGVQRARLNRFRTRTEDDW